MRKIKFAGVAALIVIAAWMLTGCLGAATTGVSVAQPTGEQVQAVRHLADKAVVATDVAVSVAGESVKIIVQLPEQVLPRADKIRVLCQIVRVFGTSTTASPAVYSLCGPTPLSADSPFAVAVGKVRSATTCPSLSASAAAVLSIADPVISSLEQSSQPAVSMVGASFRVSLLYVRSVSGGELCH